ncbi:hypothetical protein, partial [Methanocalculus sp.]|uniref:hypothetical protein n=1 Tax=Methanocalculus sp. TaxID=2004547 RepID=UPI00261D4BA7
TEEPTEEPTEESTEESTEEPTEESTEESTEEPTEEPTGGPQGEDLEILLPATMERLGEFNVTLHSGDSFEVQPVNRNDTIEVDRTTPLGALDAVYREGGLNYSTYYCLLEKELEIDSIEDIETTYESAWVVYYEDDESVYYVWNATSHKLSDGETFWLIYIHPEPDNRFEEDIATATHGLSITTTIQSENDSAAGGG